MPLIGIVTGADTTAGAAGHLWPHVAAGDDPRMNGTENLAGKSCPVRA